MRVIIRNPVRRELEVKGKRRVEQLLKELGLNPEVFIVIRGQELLTRDDLIGDEDTVELLSAISGG
jgi:sulfur carrier protein